MNKRRIAIAAEIFSTNLGDGVIYESLRYLINRIDRNIEILPLDISGRITWYLTDPYASYRLKLIALGKIKTAWLYAQLNLLRLRLAHKRRIDQVWSRILSQVDTVIIGGGQLLMDNYLDFPYKLNRLATLAKNKNIPVHLSSIGVGKNWSAEAKHLVSPLINQAVTITVRDTPSLKNLQKIFPNSKTTVTSDPAIWAAQVYKTGHNSQPLPRIGLGVINLVDIKSHLPKSLPVSEKDLIDFWLQTIRIMIKNKLTPQIFTNGNLEDARLARVLYKIVSRDLAAACTLSKQPINPFELVHQIKDYQAIVAYRLHASLIAMSCNIPSIGLVWDDKITALYQMINKSQFCLTYDHATPELIVAKLTQAMEQGCDQNSINVLKEKALEGVELIIK